MDQRPKVAMTPDALVHLRAEVDRCDERLLDLLAYRRDLSLRIASVKRERGLNILDTRREAAVVRRSGELARSRDLDAEDVRAVFWRLIEISRRAQAEKGAHPARTDGAA